MRSITPRDWVLTASDHGRGRVLVEIREQGRLVYRRFIDADDVACDYELQALIHDGMCDNVGGGRR